MEPIKKWIWQHEEYPNFNYIQSTLNTLLSKASRNTGRLEGAIYGLNDKNINLLVIDASINEILESSEIEGEILSRDSVRSSVRKKLDENFDYGNDSSTRHTDGLVSLLLDSRQNDTLLTEERLHAWHNILFPTGYSDGHKIDVATYRSDEMSVVSNKGYRETVHYLAPPHEQLRQEMNKFLDYVNSSKEDPFIKSAIAHIWFVSIHPYDDGNGRIARTITNYVLSKELGLDHKYYSLSTAIRKDRKGYYDVLEKSQNLFYNRDFDFTKWIEWHTTMISLAIESSLEQIKIITQKTKFWDKAREYPLNERQLKVLNKLLDKGVENFEGGLSTKKYANMVSTSIPTAKRDITGLIDYGLIEQVEGSAGRNTRYVMRF
ncbi:MAG: Fic family protein [uncultured Sulfurovum sp.]|uniref:Fic family protein n=1 Tax=uncultured Sulfurovum sp. TaxID=269237 RepID=A0A6S6T0G2_9BACT|nr:MAG: Fic family protein [uncultured Sulfurovum sp.]